MRAVLQRVTRASVDVKVDVQVEVKVKAEGEAGGEPGTERAGEIGPGLVVLLAVEKGDTPAQADWIARKIAELRVFEDAERRMNRSLVDLRAAGPDAGDGARASVLLVSQFTLAADCRKGRRPSFDRAAPPEDARPLLARVRQGLERAGLAVEEGRFGEHMTLELVNDGPVTIVLEPPPAGGRRRGG